MSTMEKEELADRKLLRDSRLYRHGEDAQELGMDQLEEGAGTPEPALTHATRHVRQETRILPLDQTHRLLVLHLRDRRPLCFPLHGLQDRGEYICSKSTLAVLSRDRREMRAKGVI